MRTDAPFTREPVQMENQHVQSIAAFQRREGPPMGSTIEKILDSALIPTQFPTPVVLNSMLLCQVAVTVPGVRKKIRVT